jgi:transcriptional regulator with XRE-family HTH domain
MKTNEIIKKRRLELSLTLLDIADYVGVTEATVQRYESGNIKNIKLSTMTKLAEILKTTPTHLMGWESDGEEPLPREIDLPIPDEFVIMARKSGMVSRRDRKKLYRVLNATIDAFLANYNREGK